MKNEDFQIFTDHNGNVYFSTNYTSWLDRFDVTLDNVLSNVDVSGPLFLNVISGTMGLLAILMPVILWYPRFRFRSQIA